MKTSDDMEVRIPLKTEKPLQELNRIAKRLPIDIEFEDLTYLVRDGSGWRQLLKSINGKFPSGQLTAIMGPSGAGKSTLLNILAGITMTGVKGIIKVNGHPRQMKLFNKLSSYIMQEDIVQPRLSVREAMMFAARLKLGPEIGDAEKMAVVEEVIQLLGLKKCFDTRSEYLSGGQRKRLAVALELVNNPPVIFLDEPTTGLDNVAIKQCMELLHNISKLGRTVICTIHQPPASLFQNFDQVYVMANGYCVYNGSPTQLVPFLSQAGCPCPTTSTPAEYIIEIVQSTPDTIGVLSNHIHNGKQNFRDPEETSKFSTNGPEIFEVFNDEVTQPGTTSEDILFPQSLAAQTKILLARTYLQMRRNRSILYIQFFHHLLSGLLIGGSYFGTGNNASQVVPVFKYVLCVNVFFMYTHVMVPVLLFPLEVKLMKREYFNRWYSLKAYYMALTISMVPLLIIFGMMFLTLVYLISNQPMELSRFMWFSAMGLAVALCSQGLGYVIGAAFNITNGSVVGSSALAPLLALAIYGMGYKGTIEPLMKFIMGFSYVRFGVVGFSTTLFQQREPMICPEEEDYCHYRDPKLLLDDMGMAGHEKHFEFLYIICFMLFFRIVGYATLKYRLSGELSKKIVYLASKIVRQKE